MTERVYDMHPSRITIDAIGEPGRRLFLLQASEGSQQITLKIEKQQAEALAAGIEQFLEELARRFPSQVSPTQEPLLSDLLLREPLDVLFAIGQIGLGYDESEDALVLIVQELLASDESREARVARFWTTRAQMRALSQHVKEVAARGRPICTLCGEPIDPDGHFCPKSNGRERVQQEA